MPVVSDEDFKLVSEKAQRQTSIVRNLLRAEGDERGRLLDLLRETLPPTVRVYYDQGLRVYCDKNPSLTVSTLGKGLSFAAVYIEEVLPDGSANVVKSLYGPSKLDQTTEPSPPSIWDVIQGDEYD